MARDEKHKDKMVLPMLAATVVDLGRLIREVENLNETFLQFNLRKAEPKMPRTSQLLDQTCEVNGINMLKPEDRDKLLKFLQSVKEESPVMHLSFSAEPSNNFIEKIMAWLRLEINPNLIITIGLQPNMGAGCIVRTTNHYFDFSLKQKFIDQRDLLIAKLAQPVAGEAVAVAAVPAVDTAIVPAAPTQPALQAAPEPAPEPQPEPAPAPQKIEVKVKEPA